tara:strand:+ start:367 stop:543 length:177 start_codon:yes stop_codon:yes gene_type:complete
MQELNRLNMEEFLKHESLLAEEDKYLESDDISEEHQPREEDAKETLQDNLENGTSRSQ